MAIIKSGITSDMLTVDVASKAARTTLYNTSGTEMGSVASPLQVTGTLNTGTPGSVGVYGTSSFRIVGAAATSQNLCTIRNNAGSKVIVVRRIAIDVVHSTAAADLSVRYARLFNATGVTPTGGTAPTKRKFDSNYAESQAQTEILFASSADGTASAITHTLPGGTPIREQAIGTVFTAAGVAPYMDYELIRFNETPLYIRSGETALIVNVSTLVDVITRHYVVKLIWEEV